MDLSHLTSLFDALLNWQDGVREPADQELQSLLAHDSPTLVQACATLILTQCYPKRLLPLAFLIMNQGLSRLPAVDDPNLVAQAIFHAWRGTETHIAQIAARCMPFLLYLVGIDQTTVLSDLYKLFQSSEYEGHVHLNAVIAVREIIESDMFGDPASQSWRGNLELHRQLLLEVLEIPLEHISCEFLVETVRTVTAFIRSRHLAFATEAVENRLANALEPLLKASYYSQYTELFQSIHDLFLVLLTTFNESRELQIVRIGELASGGVLKDNWDFVEISLRFFADLCGDELRRFRRNETINRYNGAVSKYCSPEGIKDCPDIYPWRPSVEHRIGAMFVVHTLVLNLVALLQRHPRALSIVRDILWIVGGYAYPAIFKALSNLTDSETVEYHLTLMLCIHGLCRAPDSATEIMETLSSGGDYLVAQSQSEEAAISELAISILGSGIRDHGLWLQEGDLDGFLAHLKGVTSGNPRVNAAAVTCLAAVLERVLPTFPDPRLGEQLYVIWCWTDAAIAAWRDADCLGLVFQLHEIVAPRLTGDASILLPEVLSRVYENLVKSPEEIPEDIQVTCQAGLLSILAVIFRCAGHLIVEETLITGRLIVQLVENHRIVAPAACVRALTEIVGALREKAESIAQPIWSIIEHDLRRGDLAFMVQVTPLLANLFTWVAPELIDTIPFVVDTIHSALHSPACTRECLPSLLRSLAIILRAVPVPCDASALEICFSQFKTASAMHFTAGDDIAIEYGNAMYQAIFSGLGAVIYQARNLEEFCQVHYGEWVDMMPEFVSEFCLLAAGETIDAYISFLKDAVEYLPLFCWPEVAQVVVRVPLLLGVVAEDPTISAQAISLWNTMLGDLGEALLRFGFFAPLPEDGFDFDWEWLEKIVADLFGPRIGN
jgi:hypothetical protein